MLQKTSRSRYTGPIEKADVHSHALVDRGFALDEALAALLDRYPPAIAEQLAALHEAERSAASKLPGNEARFLFSRKRWTPAP